MAKLKMQHVCEMINYKNQDFTQVQGRRMLKQLASTLFEYLNAVFPISVHLIKKFFMHR